jgi:FKBP-type peptidyl-prolyl cis-trans isomerase SlyD
MEHLRIYIYELTFRQAVLTLPRQGKRKEGIFGGFHFAIFNLTKEATMKIGEKTYVEMEYALTLESGEEVDRSSPGEPMGFVFGTGQIVSGLEKGIAGMEAGQRATVTVEPEDGYGAHNPELYREIPRENFPADLEIKPGMGFEAKGPHGPVVFRVNSANDEVVVADFNHPLAGERLKFELTVTEVREPRAEELARLQTEDGCTPSACSSCGSGCG